MATRVADIDSPDATDAMPWEDQDDTGGESDVDVTDVSDETLALLEEQFRRADLDERMRMMTAAQQKERSATRRYGNWIEKQATKGAMLLNEMEASRRVTARYYGVLTGGKLS